MVAIIEPKETLKTVNADESKPIAEWERLYPDLWLFIEVTREDEWEVYEGRLIVTAADSLEFVELSKTYDERNIVTLITAGESTEPQLLVVA
jgi:hypothetical protein